MSHASAGSTQNTYLQIGATTIGLVLLLVWLEGGFEHKTPPGLGAAVAAEPAKPGATARVERRETDEIFNWPGTVAALTVTQVAPKLAGRLLDIMVRAGSPVKRGQILARLDASAVQAQLGQARAALNTAEAGARRVRAEATESQSRLGQARAALTAAEAEAHRARADATRIRNLYDKEAATRQDFDGAEAAANAAEARVTQAREAIREAEAHLDETLRAAVGAADAQVAQARDAVREAESHLSDTLLVAPFDSVVVKRLQEPGDMALTGVPVLTLQQAGLLRIEAAIPASCAGLLTVGTPLTARVAPATEDLRVTVDEIQPAADASTRTVLVKARLPANAAAQPGAFAWLRQSCGHGSVLVVPAVAVSRIGQLESVRVIADGKPRLRHVRTGKRLGDSVEVLSGLTEGDTVAIPGDR